MKAYMYEIVTAIVLLGVVEVYLWSQSRTLILDSTATKIALITLYASIACASQYAISSRLRYPLQEALKANLLVAVIMSLGVTLLAFSIHRGIVKDVPEGLPSIAAAFVKFFLTIGLATLGLRIMVAALVRFRASASP